MKLSCVISVFNQIDLAKTCYKEIVANNINLENETEFIILDNGSDTPIQEIDFLGAKIIRNEKNIGVYPTIKQGFEVATGDVVAFLHSDVVIWEKGWNNKVIDRFKLNKQLGLIGFIGSNEIDSCGGRGYGTESNFQGKDLQSENNKVWFGSSWEKHGKHLVYAMKGAVVDGCAMIIKREAWDKIGYREDFPPHHFYDRLICCQMLEIGYKIYVEGIECDHISGATVNTENGYAMLAEKWCNENLGVYSFEEWVEKNKDWVNNKTNPNFQNYPKNWDSVIYQESEKRFLEEFRNKKHLIPIKI